MALPNPHVQSSGTEAPAESPRAPAGIPLEAKESRRWLKPRVHSGQLARLAPKRPKPRRLGHTDIWRRMRTLLWTWWLWFVAALALLYFGHHIAPAILAVVAIVLYHVVPESHPAVYAIETHLDPRSDEFRLTVAGATGMPLVEGNAVRLYQNGEAFFPAMMEAIEQAQHSITMEQYIFWDGVVGRRFAEAFAERARAGVPVKLMVDAIGSSTIGETVLHTLEQGGCQLAWYRPIHWYTLDRANRRTHRKSLIVDGSVAFTGGAGLADQWLNPSPLGQPPWRDTQIRVEGPAALAQQAGFAQNWLQTTGEMITGSAYFPELAPRGAVEVQTILSTPVSGASAAATMVLLALQSARRTLFIANPYFIPDGRMIAMLGDACGRGARVQLMLSGSPCDSWWARQNSVRLYGQMLHAGVEIYEYQAAMLHQKTMVVDSAWATVGTANFDHRSFSFNDETNVCFHDAALVAELEASFKRDLAFCHRIELGEWRRRGPWQWAGEMAASLLEDQV